MEKTSQSADVHDRTNGAGSTTTSFRKSGRYVRAPASDQVRVPRGEAVFVEVSEAEVNAEQAQQDQTTHGRANQKFRKVYIPPWFRLRIVLLLICLWTLSAVIGSGLTIAPLLVGRVACSSLLPSNVRGNDLYAVMVGLVLVVGTVYVIYMAPRGYHAVRSIANMAQIRRLFTKVYRFLAQTLRCFYFYGFAIVVVPTLLSLVFQLYFVIPLHTYTAALGSLTRSREATSTGNTPFSHSEAFRGLFGNSSSVLLVVSVPATTHRVHISQDWAIGFMYSRVVLHMVVSQPTSIMTVAFRRITREGYFRPDVNLATRAIILPTVLFSTIILSVPPLLTALGTNPLASAIFGFDVSHDTRVKLYRYSYPLCAAQAMAVWSTVLLSRATGRWQMRIKDEVYLIGERLHNFGEKRPPEGSKGVSKRDRTVS